MLGSDEVQETSGSRGPARSVELLPLPLPDEPDDVRGPLDGAAPATAWWVPAVIGAVLVLVGLVAAVVLADRPEPSRALGADAAGSSAPSTAAPDPTTASSAAPTTAAPTTAAPTTAAPTTAAPTTAAPTTVPTGGDQLLADGWVRTSSTAGGFTVELPSTPSTSVRPVVADGVVEQQELLAAAADVQVGITTTERGSVGGDLDAFLREVVQVAAGQLGGTAQLGSSGVAGPGRYVDFRITAASGRLVLGRALWADGRLHVVTSWGDGAQLEVVHARVTRTFSFG